MTADGAPCVRALLREAAEAYEARMTSCQMGMNGATGALFVESTHCHACGGRARGRAVVEHTLDCLISRLRAAAEGRDGR
jgi:hypothetical protein